MDRISRLSYISNLENMISSQYGLVILFRDGQSLTFDQIQGSVRVFLCGLCSACVGSLGSVIDAFSMD